MKMLSQRNFQKTRKHKANKDKNAFQSIWEFLFKSLHEVLHDIFKARIKWTSLKNVKHNKSYRTGKDTSAQQNTSIPSQPL